MSRRTLETSRSCPRHAVHFDSKRAHQRWHHRGGFSFAEVMFAVVILGIGFVMVSAIFPIAVEQTRSTIDDTVATQLARSCMNQIATVTRAEDYPDNGGITQAFADVTPLMNQMQGNLISTTDARYACVPFFCKSSVDGTVRITVLVVRRWSHDFYRAIDLTGDGELTPRGVIVYGIASQADGTQVVSIGRDPAGAYQSVTSGAILIMRSGDGDVAGRTFRLSEKISETSEADAWTISRGSDLSANESISSGYAAVIGRDWKNPADPNSGYVGPAQDVAVYTTFLRPR